MRPLHLRETHSSYRIIFDCFDFIIQKRLSRKSVVLILLPIMNHKRKQNTIYLDQMFIETYRYKTGDGSQPVHNLQKIIQNQIHTSAHPKLVEFFSCCDQIIKDKIIMFRLSHLFIKGRKIK